MEDCFVKIGWVGIISMLMHFWKCVNKTEGKLCLVLYEEKTS